MTLLHHCTITLFAFILKIYIKLKSFLLPIYLMLVFLLSILKWIVLAGCAMKRLFVRVQTIW